MTSSHADCTHPRTKAARAKCRKNKAEIAKIRAEAAIEDQIYHDTYIAPRLVQDEAEAAWNEAWPKFAQAHQDSAHENADDTAAEEGFEPYSTRWYRVALATLEQARDTADIAYDLTDPSPGQAIDMGDGDYRWIEFFGYHHKEGWLESVILVDREGNRTTHLISELPAQG